ncbi:MAG TPA: VanZ family protein [Ramlibacter sp.]|uniref:VanZ family protein n=1 Tax=Ramlibacter sp. TaxID=1917967 RepID=UPI002D7F6518|nr:VanZ family protein [Ramlibacter sp.]HET8747623.1 VanZ family protein [Ramlibacter sp.]
MATLFLPALSAALRVMLLLATIGVLLLMVVPYGVIEYLRNEFALVDGIAYFVHSIAPGGNPDHAVAFGLLGVFIWIARPRAPAWRAALGLLALGVATEVVQLWIPSRHPSVSHAVLDVLGGVAGWCFAWLANYAWGAQARA